MEICEASHYSSAVPLSLDEPLPGSQATSGNDVTQLLKRWRKGSPDAEAALMERVYGELRRLAAGYMRRERAGKTLQPTAVVNEAFLRLLPQRKCPQGSIRAAPRSTQVLFERHWRPPAMSHY